MGLGARAMGRWSRFVKLADVMADEIETDERDGFALAIDRREVFNAGSKIERIRELGEIGEELFVDATRGGENADPFCR